MSKIISSDHIVFDKQSGTQFFSHGGKIKLPFLPFQQKTSKDILEICEPLFKVFNITFFSHTRAFHDGQFAALMTSIGLTEHYIERKYPIYYSQGHGIILEPGIYVGAYMENQPSQQKIRRELRNYFNVDHMIHVIDKKESYDDMYSFATTPENNQIVNQFFNNIDIIKHFILYYNDKAANHIKKAVKIKYSSGYFDLSTEANSYMQSTHINKDCLKEMVIKKIHISSNAGKISISQREFECLGYIAKNYTLKEIAKFLKLSPRTVETYVNNLKYKLECESRTQLINIASKFNLL